MNAADVEDIAAAVEAVRHRMPPEDRFDLRQDLAIKLLTLKTRPKSVRNWARECAFNWAVNQARDEENRRKLRVDAKDGVSRPYRQNREIWQPKWYPPSKGAVEFAWWACDGARMMHVKK